MSCIKDKVVRDMVMKDMIRKDMSLFTPLPTERVLNYIEMLTKRAKTEYGVDMGPLFTINRGPQVTTQLPRLIPNDPAFDALDMSKQSEQNEIDAQIAKERYRSITLREFEARDIEANVEVVEGEVLPSFLPKINREC